MENIYHLELLAKLKQQEILDCFGICIQTNALETLKQERRSLFKDTQTRIKKLGSAIRNLFNTKSGVRKWNGLRL